MGETMSKRLKLHLGEAEMEERAFPNPFPDYEAAVSAAGLAAGAAEETGRACPLPTTDDPGLPFHPNGKVSLLPGPSPAVGRVRPPPLMVASGGHALGCDDVIGVRPVWCLSSRRGWEKAVGQLVRDLIDITWVFLPLKHLDGALCCSLGLKSEFIVGVSRF